MDSLEKGQKIVVTHDQVSRSKHKELVDVMDRAMPPVDKLEGFVKNIEGGTVWLSFPRVDQQGQYSFDVSTLEEKPEKKQAPHSDIEMK